MKTLIKVLLPLTLASTLFVGCGDGDKKAECATPCGTGKVCVLVGGNSKCEDTCANQTATPDPTCSDNSTKCKKDESKDKTLYCPAAAAAQ